MKHSLSETRTLKETPNSQVSLNKVNKFCSIKQFNVPYFPNFCRQPNEGVDCIPLHYKFTAFRTQYTENCTSHKAINFIKNQATHKQKTEERKKMKNSRVKSDSSFDNIDGVVILGLKPPIITFSDCFVDLHIFTAAPKTTLFKANWVYINLNIIAKR